MSCPSTFINLVLPVLSNTRTALESSSVFFNANDLHLYLNGLEMCQFKSLITSCFVTDMTDTILPSSLNIQNNFPKVMLNFKLPHLGA